VSVKSQTQTASPSAAMSVLRILTRCRSASALKTFSSSPASSSVSAGPESGAQQLASVSAVVITIHYIEKT
jgi:hypothetical protein